MSPIKIRFQKESIGEDDITRFENEFKIQLPSNYKTLILKYNGGIVSDSEFLKGLLSIWHGANTVESIINTHQIIEKNIPKEFLPIAYDWAGNIITINLKQGLDFGKIFAFYFDTDSLEKIADSLEKLLGVTHIEDL